MWYASLLQVVPTEYTDLKGTSTNSNQFSVTENFRESADAHLGGRSLPGVFFFYDLSPIKVGGCWLHGLSHGWGVLGSDVGSVSWQYRQQGGKGWPAHVLGV